MLEIIELESGYNKRQVLYGLSLNVKNGEIVSIIGPNGAGKSTVLKAVFGLIPTWSGNINFNGHQINGNTPAQNVISRITYAPQGNRVFNDMTVMENLELGGFQLTRDVLIDRVSSVLDLFPLLKDKIRQNASKLSGGEQQMLSLARALIPEPMLLMLDEPSLGLSPNLIRHLFDKIVHINRERGVGILIVEQKVRVVLEICARVYSMKAGKIAYSGSSLDVYNNEKLKKLFL
jgi:ABC-type branched-subunit amino acid transport system ATPase component